MDIKTLEKNIDKELLAFALKEIEEMAAERILEDGILDKVLTPFIRDSIKRLKGGGGKKK